MAGAVRLVVVIITGRARVARSGGRPAPAPGPPVAPLDGSGPPSCRCRPCYRDTPARARGCHEEASRAVTTPDIRSC